jgi:preprotein translocase SecF subunit
MFNNIKNRTIDFVGNKKIYFAIPAILLVLTIVFLLIGGLNVDIQFKGGSMITYSYDNEIDLNSVKTSVEGSIGAVTLQENNDIVNNVKKFVVSSSTNISTEQLNNLNEKLSKDFGAKYVESSTVDPTIGTEFLLKSLVAVTFAALLIVLFVWIRFRKIGGWSAGLMAIVALVVDLFTVFASFVILGFAIDMNFIAVILTILGYSVNDTIVIYDRIRENSKKFGKEKSVREIVNMSANECLTRSVRTTVTTVLTMIVVSVVAVVLNVNSILTFSIPMAFGMISGAFSSLCIALPLWVMWKERKTAK